VKRLSYPLEKLFLESAGRELKGQRRGAQRKSAKPRARRKSKSARRKAQR
jgi:hypothetical protein